MLYFYLFQVPKILFLSTENYQPSINADWCSSSNHAHFDLDYDTARELYPDILRTHTTGLLLDVEPVPCDPTKPHATYSNTQYFC